MRSIGLVLFTLVGITLARSAVTVPTAYYDAGAGVNNHGRIRLVNDLLQPIYALSLRSGNPDAGPWAVGNSLTGTPKLIPGVVFVEDGDQPQAITWFQFPTGGPYDAGDLVAWNTPGLDLWVQYYSTEQSFLSGAAPLRGVVVFPEPGAASLALCGLAVGAMGRRAYWRRRAVDEC